MKDISLESGAKAVGRECSSWFSEYSFQRREALEGERRGMFLCRLDASSLLKKDSTL